MAIALFHIIKFTHETALKSDNLGQYDLALCPNALNFNLSYRNYTIQIIIKAR